MIESELISRKILDAKASKFSCQESSVQFSSVQFSSHGRNKFVSSFLEINPLECNAMQWSR